MFPSTNTSNSGTSQGGWTSGGTDYGGCIGRQNAFDNKFDGNSVSHYLVEGKYLFYADPDNLNYTPTKRGVFLPNTWTKTNDITDGLSHTIMTGELQHMFPGDGTGMLEGENPAYAIPEHTSNDGWAVGGLSTMFDTAIYHEGGDLGQPGGFNTSFFEAAGSQHPHGANFGLANGSVRFIFDEIDTQVYAYLGSICDGATAQARSATMNMQPEPTNLSVCKTLSRRAWRSFSPH